MSKTKQLKALRDIIISRVKEIQTASEHPDLESDNTKLLEFKLRGDQLPNIYAEFMETHRNIVINLASLQQDVDLKTEDQIRSGFELLYFSVKAAYDSRFISIETSTNANISQGTQPSSNVKLPKIKLHHFDGNLKTWPTFIDLYKSLIHQNISLSKIEKFQYLISSLSGEPLSLIKTLPLTEDNYETAYRSLENRYQNKRLLATTYWKEIVNFPKVVSDSSQDLRLLLDTFTENLAALKTLGFEVEFWDFILFNCLLQKLDANTVKRFELEHSSSAIPSYEQLKSFVENQCKALDTLAFTKTDNKTTSSKNTTTTPKSYSFHPKRSSNTTSAFIIQPGNVQKCWLCKNNHSIYSCPTLITKSPAERYHLVKQNHLCVNCLSNKHSAKLCRSSSSCKVCRQRHHSLLHFEEDKLASARIDPPVSINPVASTSVTVSGNGTPSTDQFGAISKPTSSPPVTSSISNQNASLNLLTNSNATHRKVLLPTAIVQILNRKGIPIKARALIDSGSMVCFITERMCHRLGLEPTDKNIPIHGLGQTMSLISKGSTHCTLLTSDENSTLNIEAAIVPKICYNLPYSSFKNEKWAHLENISLADPYFNISANIDLLLGAEIFSLIMKNGKRTGKQDEPIALETAFGWILTGTVQSTFVVDQNYSFSLFVDPSFVLNDTLKRFWELEEIPEITNRTSPEEAQCEQSFVNSYFRDSTGRFTVALPFKNGEPYFCGSRSIALKRFLRLERRLLHNPSLYQEYCQFMKDYLAKGHMESISNTLDDVSAHKVYYIPHHAVLKLDSSTTKVRVVFDASTKNGEFSLNDHLLVGPKLQQDISIVLLHFRLPKIVFTADIKQMYRQINLTSEHQDYQRIVWRFSTRDPVQDFRLKVVTFGMNCSPFLALRSLRQLAKEEEAHFPNAAKIILNNVYVDDVVAGCNTFSEAILLKDELMALLKKGQFELRKWSSNNSELLSTIPEELQEKPLSFDKEAQSVIKVLGLIWCPVQDCFSYYIKPINYKSCTKRIILSEISRVFDPLGFLAPLTFLTKHMMQHLWARGISWDEAPPDDILSRWKQYKVELPILSSLKINRRIGYTPNAHIELHGFADASELGFASVIYFRILNEENNTKTFLVCAKSKVAPLKRISLPRLELCAAVLLANLMDFIIRTYSHITFNNIFAWTDSSVVLDWIRSPSYRWKTFVCNRVSLIQDKIAPQFWRHVPSELNPADCASRGLLPSTLQKHTIWWSGPEFLSHSSDYWPDLHSLPSRNPGMASEEEKNLVLTTVTTDVPEPLDILLDKFSSFSKIERIVSYILRFKHNVTSVDNKKSGALSEQEIHEAGLKLVKYVQSVCFREDINNLLRNRYCSKPLRKLCPFLDESGLLRVGGRLANSQLSRDHKHPLLLPRKHRLTALVIQHFHEKYLHPGLQTLQYLLLQNFWILSAKLAIRQCLYKCLRCFRVNPRSAVTKMADLPSFRVRQLKAFQCVGVDFGGPYFIKLGRTRGAKTGKAYICLFVCCTTKAVHIELVSELSTNAFLAALRRFISRRGKCTEIHSDQGTNFVGASKYLAEVFKTVTDTELIKWRFIPPHAPHFGGLWEAGIKSVKTHLLRVIGEQILTFEEFYTVLTQIEAVLNSRPLCSLSQDPNDLVALSPGHFLTLAPLSSVPDFDLTALKLNRLDRWQLLVRLHQDFWKRWHQEYLHTLTQRYKWNQSAENITVGSLVVLKNDNTSPLQWSLGRITEIFPGADGIVRVVNVRTSKGVFKRALSKICPLPYY